MMMFTGVDRNEGKDCYEFYAGSRSRCNFPTVINKFVSLDLEKIQYRGICFDLVTGKIEPSLR